LVRRRISHCLGAAAGGVLGVAFLPMAVAFADSYEIIPDPSSTEEITGFFGEPATPPAVAGSIQGQQVFEVFDTTTDKTVGTFDADESTNPSLYGAANELLLVTKDLSGTAGTATGDTPPVGSVIDIANYGGGYQTIYSALASPPNGDVVTDSWTNPLGPGPSRPLMTSPRVLALTRWTPHPCDSPTATTSLPPPGLPKISPQ